MYSPFGNLESTVASFLEVIVIVVPSSLTFRLSLLEVTLLKSILPFFDVIVNTAPSSSVVPVMSVLLIVVVVGASFMITVLSVVSSSFMNTFPSLTVNLMSSAIV